MSIFETFMLVCFGAAWPINIYKSYKTASTAGKSPIFLYVIIVGYIFGIINKLFYNKDIVMFLYLVNLCMVLIDLILYYRNKKLDKRNLKEGKN